jgi:valyl-tRNA synthetase
MPFVTEEVWGILCNSIQLPAIWEDSLIISSYPEGNDKLNDSPAESDMNVLFALVSAIRNVRGELRIPQNALLEAHIYSTTKSMLLKDNNQIIKKLASVNPTISGRPPDTQFEGNSVSLITIGATVEIIIGADIDMDKEKARLADDKNEVSKYVRSIEGRLANSGFIENAPEEVIEKERERLGRAKERQERIEDIIQKLV